VPFTVALAVFTAFPMLRDIPGALQGWLVRSLILTTSPARWAT
jgi:hypothetical protein